MRNVFFLMLFALMVVRTTAQRVIDSLKHVLATAQSDSIIFRSSLKLAELYVFDQSDSSAAYVKKAMSIAEKKDDRQWKAHANYTRAMYLLFSGNYPAALQALSENIDEFAQYRDPFVLALSNHLIAMVYNDNNLAKKNLEYALKAKAVLDTLHYTNDLFSGHFLNSRDKLFTAIYGVMGLAYLSLNRIDSALFFTQQSCELDLNKQIGWNTPVRILASMYEIKGNRTAALRLYKQAFDMAMDEPIVKDAVDCYNSIAMLYKELGETDSAVLYARKSIALKKDIHYPSGALDAGLLLSDVYEKRGKNDSALYYFKYAMNARDSFSNQEKIEEIQRMVFAEDLRRQELRQQALLQQTTYRNRIKVYAVLGVAIALLSLAFILWRNNRRKQRDKVKLEQAYQNLESTQSQLIQSEKMASLGELTAGIAHEIQNPLNFVNNFSEVNGELIKELKREVSTGNMQEVTAIADDIEANSEKINHHGKRADAIVKGMLQHSRTSSGQKETTDINKLADEYLRLSYQGFRARDKSFNATIVSEFDDNLGNVNIIPQEIGRVILNLINNAFYAVNEKQKQNLSGYEPTITVSTSKLNDKVEIKVSDNGNGIPAAIKEKIFQPFFTTKPTGQGTGLGLSLAYDIIKAHGGEITVETKEGEGSEFIILLKNSQPL